LVKTADAGYRLVAFLVNPMSPRCLPTATSRIPYSVPEREVGSPPPVARDKVAGSSAHILWFGSGGAIPSSRPLYRKRWRAQRRSMMARKRHHRLVID